MDYSNDKEYMDALKSSDFKKVCVLPFIHLATTTEGNARLCCKVSRHNPITDENGKPYNVNTHSIKEIWESEYMRDVRMRLLKGEQIPQCSVCWKEEETFYTEWNDSKDSKLPSKRRKENQKWNHKPDTKIQQAYKGEMLIEPKIRYFDIRLSNLCNLKCRMCWPQFSSQIAKEQQQYANTGQDTHYRDYNVPEWDTERLWQGISDNSLHIEEITFVGGEPTMHSEMYDLLEKLIATDVAKNIRLKLTTNLTNVQQRFLDMLPHFASVIVNTSLDGIGAVNNYVRHPSKWDALEANLDKLLALTTEMELAVNVTPVVQAYTIFDLGNIVKWYCTKWIDYPNKFKFTMAPDLLYDPSYLSAKLLSRDAKDRWYHEVFVPTLDWIDNLIENINDYEEEVRNNWRHFLDIRERFVNIAMYIEVMKLNDEGKLTFMAHSSTYSEDRDSLVVKLKNYTAQLDKHRGESIYDIIPDWDDLF